MPIIPSEESALSKLLASGSDIITSANDLLLRANEVLSRENVDRISKTLENLEGVTSTVNGQREDLSAALKQLASATGELKHTLTTLDSMATTTNDLMKNNARQVLESTNKALESVDQDRELLQSVLEAYFEESATVLAQVERSVAQKDAAALKRSAHTLKGVLLAVGAQATSQVAFELERMGSTGDLAGSEPVLVALQRQMAAIEPVLKAGPPK